MAIRAEFSRQTGPEIFIAGPLFICILFIAYGCSPPKPKGALPEVVSIRIEELMELHPDFVDIKELRTIGAWTEPILVSSTVGNLSKLPTALGKGEPIESSSFHEEPIDPLRTASVIEKLNSEDSKSLQVIEERQFESAKRRSASAIALERERLLHEPPPVLVLKEIDRKRLFRLKLNQIALESQVRGSTDPLRGIASQRLDKVETEIRQLETVNLLEPMQAGRDIKLALDKFTQQIQNNLKAEIASSSASSVQAFNRRRDHRAEQAVTAKVIVPKQPAQLLPPLPKNSDSKLLSNLFSAKTMQVGGKMYADEKSKHPLVVHPTGLKDLESQLSNFVRQDTQHKVDEWLNQHGKRLAIKGEFGVRDVTSEIRAWLTLKEPAEKSAK